MEEKKNISNKAWWIIIIILAVAIIFVVVFSTVNNNTGTTSPVVSSQPQSSTQYSTQTSSVVRVEKEITASIIEEGLKNMGTLLCEKYYFTELVNFSSVKKFLNIKVPLTSTEYLASYDGVVTAGIDFDAVKVEKDDQNHVIRIYLPASEIQNVDIDPKSFVLYNEKSGLGNPVSISDFNMSLIELEENASAKALEKGLIEKSDENAKQMVKSFVSGLIDTSKYKIEFIN